MLNFTKGSRNEPLKATQTLDEMEEKSSVSGVLRASKFSDRYREKNLNIVRPLFKAGKNVRNILWEIGLRGNEKTD